MQMLYLFSYLFKKDSFFLFMLFRTHFVFALFIGLVSFSYFNLNPYLFVFLVVLCASLIDIDEPKSKIGSRLWILSFPLKFLFGHRKLMHSLFVWGLIGFILSLFTDYWIPCLIGFFSHLFLDGLTKGGINIYPFNFRVNGFLRTGGIIEFGLFVLLVVFNLFFIWKYLL